MRKRTADCREKRRTSSLHQYSRFWGQSYLLEILLVDRSGHETEASKKNAIMREIASTLIVGG
jgi:hypothetical protein